MSSLISPFWEAVGIIGGMIIGSGMFALPYAVSVSGLWASLFNALLAFFFVLSIHLAYGEIVVNASESHRLPGYARLYLGRAMGYLSRGSQLLTFNSALLIYGILGGIFLNSIFGGGAAFWSLVFFAVGALILLFEPAKEIGSINLVFMFFIIAATLFVSLAAFGKGSVSNLPFYGSDPFFSFGVFVFALTGLSIIADAREILKKKTEGHKLKDAIILGTVSPLILYFIFVFAVLTAANGGVTQDALTGLAGVLGRNILIVGALIGVLAMFTSYLSLGYDLRKIYELDIGARKIFSWALATLIPAALFVFLTGNFTKLISIAGGVFVSVDGLTVVLILSHMRRHRLIKERFLPFYAWEKVLLLAILFLSAFYEIIYQIL